MNEKPINLNRFRKARARDDSQKTAHENAVKHGRTKAERDLEEAKRTREASRLEGHKRETGPE